MTTLSLKATARYMPEHVVTDADFPCINDSNSRMFQGTRLRRHVDQTMTSTEMLARAIEQMAGELQEQEGFVLADEVDAILTNLALPDLPFTGSGAMLAKRAGLKPKLILDLHNGGCVSFIALLDLARGLVASHGLKNILICNTQTAAGRIFSHPDHRHQPQSAIPGDGAGVALITVGGPNPIEHVLVKIHPEYAEDMQIVCDDQRQWWQPGARQFSINFDEHKLAAIVMRGNRLVPAVMRELLAQAGLTAGALYGLITNQPNPFFLRNWREALSLPESRHFHTFETYANLFQAGIPVNLDAALRAGAIPADSRIMLAGFSHAGDYSAAAILHWQKGPLLSRTFFSRPCDERPHPGRTVP